MNCTFPERDYEGLYSEIRNNSTCPQQLMKIAKTLLIENKQLSKQNKKQSYALQQIHLLVCELHTELQKKMFEAHVFEKLYRIHLETSEQGNSIKHLGNVLNKSHNDPEALVLDYKFGLLRRCSCVALENLRYIKFLGDTLGKGLSKCERTFWPAFEEACGEALRSTTKLSTVLNHQSALFFGDPSNDKRKRLNSTIKSTEHKRSKTERENVSKSLVKKNKAKQRKKFKKVIHDVSQVNDKQGLCDEYQQSENIELEVEVPISVKPKERKSNKLGLPSASHINNRQELNDEISEIPDTGLGVEFPVSVKPKRRKKQKTISASQINNEYELSEASQSQEFQDLLSSKPNQVKRNITFHSRDQTNKEQEFLEVSDSVELKVPAQIKPKQKKRNKTVFKNAESSYEQGVNGNVSETETNELTGSDIVRKHCLVSLIDVLKNPVAESDVDVYHYKQANLPKDIEDNEYEVVDDANTSDEENDNMSNCDDESVLMENNTEVQSELCTSPYEFNDETDHSELDTNSKEGDNDEQDELASTKFLDEMDEEEVDDNHYDGVDEEEMDDNHDDDEEEEVEEEDSEENRNDESKREKAASEEGREPVPGTSKSHNVIDKKGPRTPPSPSQSKRGPRTPSPPAHLRGPRTPSPTHHFRRGPRTPPWIPPPSVRFLRGPRTPPRTPPESEVSSSDDSE